MNTFTANFQSTPTPGTTSFSLPLNTTLNEWIIDSSAINHVVSIIKIFTLYRPVDNMFVALLNSEIVLLTHVGDVYIFPTFVLHSALYT